MLANRIVLAEYFTTDDVILIFGVRADWREPQVVEIQRPLSEIRHYVSEHFGPGTEDSQTSTAERIRSLDLAEWQAQFGPLIEPIKEWAEPGDYLYLVPHDVLHYLPLHTLELEGRPLIERNPVLYTPSASVLKYCQAKRKGRRERALVLGDSNGDLIHARAEAIAVANLFQTRAYLGPEARESLVRARLKEEMEDIDVLHFACHGRFDHRQPLQSGILMAPEPNGEEPATYEPKLHDLPISRYLTAEEFFGIELRADLVTLSACDSGVSEIRPGDELFGLMRALIYAGTPSVVMSLWPVDQISSSILMQLFYQTLLKDSTLTKVEALQRAQLALKDLTVCQALDYCQEAIILLDQAGQEAARQALIEDTADLHFQAGNYEQAGMIYQTLFYEAEREQNEPRYRALDAALARCELLRVEPPRPNYEKAIYDHLFYWAPFILIGDWK